MLQWRTDQHDERLELRSVRDRVQRRQRRELLDLGWALLLSWVHRVERVLVTLLLELVQPAELRRQRLRGQLFGDVLPRGDALRERQRS